MLNLDAPVASLGVTARRRADILSGMGLATVRDLLFHFPLRHESFDASAEIGSVQPDTSVSVTAEIRKCANRRAWKRRMTMTEALLDDGTGTIVALWFNQPYLVKSMAPGRVYRFTGKVTKTKFGLRLMNPAYEAMDRGYGAGALGGSLRERSGTKNDGLASGSDGSTAFAKGAAEAATALLPVYPLSVGMSQNALRKIVAAALPAAADVEDPLPEAVRKAYKLPSLGAAVRGVHAPKDADELAAARHRLAFDEVLRLQLALGRLRRLREKRPAPVVPYGEAEIAAIREFTATLPFALTDDQRKAAQHALKDMERGHQMHRLLDGDVGSGKTLVAAIAMMNAARAGFQCAIMAPTEILAAQHFATLSRLFAGQPFTAALWTGAYKRSARKGKEIACANKAECARLGEEIADGEVRASSGHTRSSRIRSASRGSASRWSTSSTGSACASASCSPASPGSTGSGRTCSR
jgi:ATP-dependent DNA helicase RecG